MTDYSVLINSQLKTDIMNRVQEGYGLNISRNSELCAKNSELKSVWNWLAWVEKTRGVPSGMISLIENSAQSSPRQLGSRIVYESNERSKFLKLCGWAELGSMDDLEAICNNAIEEGNVERATMLAVFHYNLAKARTILPSDYALSAVLHTVLDNEPHPQVKKLCLALSQQAENPYLSATLTFLAGTEHHQGTIDKLNSIDRIGFCSRFYSEPELVEMLEKEVELAMSNGNLDALMICGATENGLQILEAYLKRTYDIQTVGLISAIISMKYETDKSTS